MFPIQPEALQSIDKVILNGFTKTGNKCFRIFFHIVADPVQHHSDKHIGINLCDELFVLLLNDHIFGKFIQYIQQ